MKGQYKIEVCSAPIVAEEPDLPEEPGRLELIEQLGLKGQKVDLNAPNPVPQVPYRRYTDEEKAVYGTLLPVHEEVADFSRSPIPMKVLEEIAKAAPLFVKLEVHFGDRLPNLYVLTGTRKERLPNRTWDDNIVYIVARWAPSFPSFDTLRDKAKAALVEAWETRLTSIANKCNLLKSQCETIAHEMVTGGESKDAPYFSW